MPVLRQPRGALPAGCCALLRSVFLDLPSQRIRSGHDYTVVTNHLACGWVENGLQRHFFVSRAGTLLAPNSRARIQGPQTPRPEISHSVEAKKQ